MKHKLTHFAIHTDDIQRAKSFYKAVFDWAFNTYGPDDFFQIKTGDTENDELIGALQSRKYSAIKEKINGLEGTIGVENIDEIIEKVDSNGGKIVLPKTSIPHVGWICKFLDTEGNLLCAMQYDANAQ